MDHGTNLFIYPCQVLFPETLWCILGHLYYQTIGDWFSSCYITALRFFVESRERALCTSHEKRIRLMFYRTSRSHGKHPCSSLFSSTFVDQHQRIRSLI